MLIHSFIVGIFWCSIAAAADGTVVKLDFSTETLGAISTSAPPVVGQWVIAADGDNHVLQVDGQHWRHDHLPDGLAATATTLFADAGKTFVERIRAHPDYPLAVIPAVNDFSSGTISVRFKPLVGSEDQAAGIAFNLGTNADYLLVRANALEDNLGYFRVVNGSRQTLKWAEHTPTPTQQWHILAVTITGTDLSVSLDGAIHLTHKLAAPVTGKVALWSKADSVVLFDDVTIIPSHP